MTSRALALSLGALTFAITGTLAAAPGVYPTEPGPDPVPSGKLASPQAEESAFRIDDTISVVQAVGPNGAPVSVPICVSPTNKVGHVYAKKGGASYSPICRVAGSTSTPMGQVVKPTGQQASSVYWVPLQKGAALPRTLAPLSIGPTGVAVYACKVKSGPNDLVGTLLPTGECEIAPMIRGLGGDRVEASSLVLVRAGSQGATAAPAYGWIYLKRGQHHPGGSATLVRWPNGAAYCQGKVQGTTWPGFLESAPDGSVVGCATWQPGAFITTSEGVAVFRNDAQSGVELSDAAGPEVPRVMAGGRVPCSIERAGTAHLGYMEGTRCLTRTTLQAPGDRVRQLVRRGPWPDQG